MKDSCCLLSTYCIPGDCARHSADILVNTDDIPCKKKKSTLFLFYRRRLVSKRVENSPDYAQVVSGTTKTAQGSLPPGKGLDELKHGSLFLLREPQGGQAGPTQELVWRPQGATWAPRPGIREADGCGVGTAQGTWG